MSVHKISNDLKYLEPILRFKVLEMLDQIKAWGLPFAVFETGRSLERQKYIMSKGYTRTLKSRHLINLDNKELSTAVDFVYYDNHGWSWDYLKHAMDYDNLGKIGQRLGLEWGGDWRTFKDYPHFQLCKKDIKMNEKYFKGELDV